MINGAVGFRRPKHSLGLRDHGRFDIGLYALMEACYVSKSEMSFWEQRVRLCYNSHCAVKGL